MINSEKFKEIKRISIALDPDMFNRLKELARNRGQTISQIVRSAIMDILESEFRGNSRELNIYADFLSAGEHVIVSAELWVEMLRELENSASNRFWESVEDEGYRRGLYYKSIGLNSLRDILNHLKYKNWFRLKITKNCYMLILVTSNVRKFLMKYLTGILKALRASVEISEFERYILIMEDKSS